MRNPLHSLCPYFAMFPEQFAHRYIERFSDAGDYVLDPCSGRGTTLLEALLMGRRAAAIDINPVAYCVSAAKASVPALGTVLEVIRDLEERHAVADHKSLAAERLRLPPFFRRAFYYTTLEQILFLRHELDWRGNDIHQFVAALVLGSLHGEITSPSYFSNQMPRTISTKPRYSLTYWRKNRLWPRKRDVFHILASRARFRLAHEVPLTRGQVAQSDARLAASVFPNLRRKIKLVITSPPYLDVTNYEEDQWLRLWFLGAAPRPSYGKLSRDDRHGSADSYWQFLQEVWSGVAPLLSANAKLVCRIGAKDIDIAEATSRLLQSVRPALPSARLFSPPIVSAIRNRQTEVFRPGSGGCVVEIDFVFAV